MHAINYKKGKQIIFSSIDISVPVERVINGKKVPLAAVIRNSDSKTIAEIHNEIQAFKQ